MNTGWTDMSDENTPIPDIWYQNSDQDNTPWIYRGAISKPLGELVKSVLTVANAYAPGIQWSVNARQELEYVAIDLRGTITIQGVDIHCCAELSPHEVDRDAERYIHFFIDNVLVAAVRKYATESRDEVVQRR